MASAGGTNGGAKNRDMSWRMTVSPSVDTRSLIGAGAAQQRPSGEQLGDSVLRRPRVTVW